jgi:hypothetical protein
MLHLLTLLLFFVVAKCVFLSTTNTFLKSPCQDQSSVASDDTKKPFVPCLFRKPKYSLDMYSISLLPNQPTVLFYSSSSQTRSEGRWCEYVLAYASCCDLSEADVRNDRLLHNHRCAVNTPTVCVQGKFCSDGTVLGSMYNGGES